MIWKDVKDNWTAHVPGLLTRWPELDETEVLDTDGNRAAFAALVARDTDLSPSVADAEISDWLMGLEPADAVMDPTRDNARLRDSAAYVADGEDVYDDDDAFGDADGAAPPVGRSL